MERMEDQSFINRTVPSLSSFIGGESSEKDMYEESLLKTYSAPSYTSQLLLFHLNQRVKLNSFKVNRPKHVVFGILFIFQL